MHTTQTAQIIPFPVRPHAAWPSGAIGIELERIACLVATRRGMCLAEARRCTLDAYQAVWPELKSNPGEL